MDVASKIPNLPNYENYALWTELFHVILVLEIPTHLQAMYCTNHQFLSH